MDKDITKLRLLILIKVVNVQKICFLIFISYSANSYHKCIESNIITNISQSVCFPITFTGESDYCTS